MEKQKDLSVISSLLLQTTEIKNLTFRLNTTLWSSNLWGQKLKIPKGFMLSILLLLLMISNGKGSTKTRGPILASSDAALRKEPFSVAKNQKWSLSTLLT